MKMIKGQILLVLCCFFYLIWWYRGYHPGMAVNRVSGVNGLLLLITVLLGISGVIFSMTPAEAVGETRIRPFWIITGGIVCYAVLFLITRFGFGRAVTTELFLIVGWTMLEVSVISRLNAAGNLSDSSFTVLCCLIASAFVVSMILYAAYYRMEEMKAFYSAMVPLVTEAAVMAVLIGMVRK